MSGSNLTPTLLPVTVSGKKYRLVAFYFPGYKMPWDITYGAPFFSNFWPCTVTVTANTGKGLGPDAIGTFHNAEAAFQALKWWYDKNLRAQFETCVTGDDAFRLKRKLQSNSSTPPDYSYAGNGDNLGGMAVVLKAKFADPKLAAALIATKDAYLLEHNSNNTRDDFWSDNADGLGGNNLGISLMTQRQNLGGKPNPAPFPTDTAPHGRVQRINLFTAEVI